MANKRAPTSDDTPSTEVEQYRVEVSKVLKRGPRPTYDWVSSEEDFVNGISNGDDLKYESLKELSQRTGIPYASVQVRASNHRWKDKRSAQQMVLAQKRTAERAKKLVKDAVDFDASALTAAKIGVAMVTTRLGEIARDAAASAPRIAEARARLEAGLPVEKRDLYSAVFHRELVDLASALATFQTVGMRALGTDVNRMEITGANGEEIQHAVSVVNEMQRDDPDRTAQLIRALADSKIITLAIEAGDIEDAEIVEEEAP